MSFNFDNYKPLLCIIGALMINLTLGTFYTISNVIPYLASYMRQNGNPTVTTEHGAWLTASFLLGQGTFMILGAYLERKFNNRVACIAGCIVHCASTFATIWAINVSFTMVILVYGLGSGLGCGSSYVASIISAQKWYPQRKGLFTGIIVAGFGFGGLIFSPLQTLYLNPENQSQDAAGYFNESVYQRVPTLFLYMGIIFTCAQSIGCLLAFKPPDNLSDQNSNETFGGNRNQNGTTISEEVLPEVKSFTSAFKYKIFYIIGLMMMLVAPGVTFVNSLGKRYGQTYIMDDRFLSLVVAVAAAANAMGRLTWGCIMDRFSFSTCYTIKVILFGVLIILFPFAFILKSKTLFLVWMLGLFFGFSGTFVLFPLFIEQVFGSKYHGLIYGILYIALAISSSITSLLIQMIISPELATSKNPESSFMVRLGPCIVIGVLYFLSYILYILTMPVRRLENAIKRRVEANLIARQSLFNRQDLFPAERGTLAEKTMGAIAANEGSGGPLKPLGTNLERENSLGSIVRIRDGPREARKINNFPKL